jgi:predicted nucleotidyltransferase component of viral defense system
MLTRAQIQRLAQRHHIGMQVQERDYLQHLLLSLLYARSQSLTFKGGTAVRLVYRGNRYSEDLDFNGPDDMDSLRRTWGDIVADLQDFGILAQMRDEWQSDVGYSFDVSYAGPLYDRRDHSKGKVRVDVNRRLEAVETWRELIHSEYDDVRPFVVTVLTAEHMLAEKVRALLVRGKPRDLYDIWLLLRQGVSPDRSLIERKLQLYGIAFTPQALAEAATRVWPDWERDLRPLLPQFVAYEDVVDTVRRFIGRYSDTG